MSKQSSIEWFAEKDTELTIQFLEGKLNQIQLAIEKMQCLQQAKQMHKEEIKNSYSALICDAYGNVKSAEQYYQETYGGNNES